jgi:hypothetical protein
MYFHFIGLNEILGFAKYVIFYILPNVCLPNNNNSMIVYPTMSASEF